MPYFWLKTDPEFKREWDKACYTGANIGSANAIKALNRILRNPNTKDSDKIQAAKVILDVDGKLKHRGDPPQTYTATRNIGFDAAGDCKDC